MRATSRGRLCACWACVWACGCEMELWLIGMQLALLGCLSSAVGLVLLDDQFEDDGPGLDAADTQPGRVDAAGAAAS